MSTQQIDEMSAPEFRVNSMHFERIRIDSSRHVVPSFHPFNRKAIEWNAANQWMAVVV